MPSTGLPTSNTRRVAVRRARIGHALRTAGQDDADRRARADLSAGVSGGQISEYTESSRRRRAMSCVYCDPKSRTMMV